MHSARVDHHGRRSFLKLCAVGGALALNACNLSGSGQPQATSTTTTLPAQGSTVTTISMLSYGPPIKPVLESFEKAHPGTKVNVFEPSGRTEQEIYEELVRQLGDGQSIPDVLVISGAGLGALAVTDGLADLTAPPFDGGSLRTQYPVWTWDAAQQAGKQIGLPWQVATSVLVYRADLLKKAGLTSEPDALQQRLQSWDDLIALAREYKQKFPDLAFFTSAEEVFWTAVVAQGANWVDGSKVMIEELGTPAATYAAQVQQHKLDSPSNPNLWNPATNLRSALLEGQVVAFLVSGAAIGDYSMAQNFPQLTGKWRIARLPGSGIQGSNYLAIAQQSQRQELAWKLVQYLSTDVEAQNTMLLHSGWLPALTAAWSSPLYSQPVEYYGGQPIYQVLLQVIQAGSLQKSSAYEYQANQVVTDALKRILQKDEDPGIVMHEAEQQLIHKEPGLIP